MNELARWCPSLRAIRFHGAKEEREALSAEYFTNEAAAHDGRRPTGRVRNEATGEMEDDNSDNPRAWDVCVTTYEVANAERKALGRFAWKYLVIDEGKCLVRARVGPENHVPPVSSPRTPPSRASPSAEERGVHFQHHRPELQYHVPALVDGHAAAGE